jgi:hypothetical protein
MKPKDIMKSEDGKYLLEQVDNSIYFRIIEGSQQENYRYMDVTPIMNEDKFVRISNRIKKIGINENIARPNTDCWSYEHKRFGKIIAVFDFYQPKPCYRIRINGYEFIYYPEGGFDVREDENLSSTWFYNVPYYQNGHVYIYTDNSVMTDDELFEACKIEIKNLMKL